MLSRVRTSESGFTLVELLVVMMLLGAVGVMVMAGIVQAFQSNEQAQRRMEAMTELRQASERIEREVRAACPIDPLGAADTTVRVPRDGGLYDHRFHLDGDVLRHEITAPDGSTTQSDLLRQVTSTPIFVFLGENDDEDGWKALDPATAEFREVVAVELRLQRDIADQPPVDIETVIQIRNKGRSCGI